MYIQNTMYISMHKCIHIHTYILTYIRELICYTPCACTHIHLHMYICIILHVYVYIPKTVYISMHECIHIHTCILTHKRTDNKHAQNTESTESCDSDGRADTSIDCSNDRDEDEEKRRSKPNSVGDHCSNCEKRSGHGADGECDVCDDGHASHTAPEDKALVKYWELDPKSLKRERCIGRGSCGSVWEGTWLRAKVAIKELDVTVSCAHSRGEVGYHFNLVFCVCVCVCVPSLRYDGECLKAQSNQCMCGVQHAYRRVPFKCVGSKN
jgi:hypothetical protein